MADRPQNAATRANVNTRFSPSRGADVPHSQSNPHQLAEKTARRFIPTTALLLIAALGGCAKKTDHVKVEDPKLANYVRLIMPQNVEIQRYLTKPVSFAGDGSANGLEVLLAAYDSFGDLTKIVGTLHIELHTMRMASGDRLGERIAFWPIELTSDKALTLYWDPLARFYRFHLQLEQSTLPPGRYILTVRLLSPTGERLFDEYEFEHDGAPVPIIRTDR